VYDNDGYWYYRRHRTVEEAPGGEGDVQFHAVNYSPPFQAPLPPGSSPDAQDTLFAALAAFEGLLAKEEAQYEFTMQEGDMVIFDNRRVLHARRAFHNKPDQGELREGEATRWLKGCYMDGDVVWNKMRVMNRRVRTGEVEPLEEWKEVLKSRGMGGS
jgi:gamma-butyrobetaine dioxygenase